MKNNFHAFWDKLSIFFPPYFFRGKIYSVYDGKNEKAERERRWEKGLRAIACLQGNNAAITRPWQLSRGRSTRIALAVQDEVEESYPLSKSNTEYGITFASLLRASSYPMARNDIFIFYSGVGKQVKETKCDTRHLFYYLSVYYRKKNVIEKYFYRVRRKSCSKFTLKVIMKMRNR